MVTELQQFKDDYDQNLPLWRVLPEFVKKHPRYERIGLRDLCDKIHAMYKKYNVAKITNDMYLSNIETGMTPADAWAKMAHREIERVSIDDIEGRITAMLVTPYPPGIPLMVPGERFNKTIISYLTFARDFNSALPGFETDVHGLVKETVNGVEGYYIDVVKE
jgi:arginine decarboxylase